MKDLALDTKQIQTEKGEAEKDKISKEQRASASASASASTLFLPNPMAGFVPMSHNGIQTPLKFVPRFSRVSSPPQFQVLTKTSIHFASLRDSTHHHHVSVVDCHRVRFSSVARAKKTQQDENLSTSEETKRISSQSSDGINIVDNDAHTVPSVGTREENIQGTEDARSNSVRTVVFWVCTAVAFGVGLGLRDGAGKATEFFAGYLLEQSLSVDNLFVFVLIFRYFKVPSAYQSRVLSYGIAGAVIFRLALILLGTVTLQKFEAVNLLLASILLFSSYKLLAGGEDEDDLSDNFIVKTCQKFIPVTSDYDGDRFFTVQDDIWKATPLLLTVVVIELSDIAFAVDSIPAVFGVTRDPLIVFSSNLFAILGLRSLYTLISESMSELEYLQPAIATVLGFIGCKMISDFFGYHISTEVSLGFVATSLSAGVLLSLGKKSD